MECIARNWRTARCEIDLIMKDTITVYFVEVKYRSNATYGDGAEYITPVKQRQMRFAAESWIAAHGWEGDAELVAVSVGPGENEIEVLFL